MKHITTLLLILTFSIAGFAGGGVTFIQNMTWEQIKAKAAREKKMIFFDAYTTWCGPCKYLENSVYTDASVGTYYNDNFINVKFDMEDGEGIALAEEFGITSYPTLLFFSSDGKMVHKFIGAMEAPKFIQLGKEAKDPARQYYTLKQKIVDRKATTADFVKWTQMADDLEDGNRGPVAADWLSTQSDILASEELARAALLYSDVNETQLAYLYRNKDRIQKLLGWDELKTNTTLYRKLFTMALNMVDTDKDEAVAFSALIQKFEPLNLYYALKDLELLLVLNRDRDSKKGIEILGASIKGTERISLAQMVALLIDYSPRFNKDDMEIFRLTLENYQFSSVDAGQECWLYLAQVICYSKLDDQANAKVAAAKAYQHANLPDDYKAILKESYNL